jgi:hypothetical protein
MEARDALVELPRRLANAPMCRIAETPKNREMCAKARDVPEEREAITKEASLSRLNLSPMPC